MKYQASMFILFLLMAAPVYAVSLPPQDLTDYASINWEKYGKEATVTQYSKAETCPRESCVTANGSTPLPFGTAACPRSIPFGKRFIVQGIEVGGLNWVGPIVCTDRTALRYDGRFDIFAFSYEEAIAFGKKKMIVTILP